MPNEHKHMNRERAGCLENKGGMASLHLSFHRSLSSPPEACAAGPVQGNLDLIR